VIHHAFGPREHRHVAEPSLPETLELDACYRYCEAMARARHHNFPVASRFVPSHLRKHIWAVYAFARTADDYADEPEFEGRRSLELDRWEGRLESCFHGETPDHPVFVALADTARRFDLPITPFAALLAGFRTDLEAKRFGTYQDLRAYTALSAEPVGQLFLYLSGFRDPHLLRYVDALASALAEAKLWQDIRHDLIKRDRVYVPFEDLSHFGVTIAGLKAEEPEEGFDDLVRFLVARTRALFMRARPLIERVGDDIAVEMAISWHGGMRILDKIEHAGADLFVRRPQLNNADKALVVSRALAWRGGSLPRRLWL
jgi:squalene synthase HpnC